MRIVINGIYSIQTADQSTERAGPVCMQDTITENDNFRGGTTAPDWQDDNKSKLNRERVVPVDTNDIIA